jgi:hypothetical protein
MCFTESVWGRYFENSKVEGTINTDLARLYPEEHGSFFQSKTCQAILKRVLLVWALIHPQYGYQQGTMKNDSICFFEFTVLLFRIAFLYD